MIKLRIENHGIYCVCDIFYIRFTKVRNQNCCFPPKKTHEQTVRDKVEIRKFEFNIKVQSQFNADSSL